MPFLCGAGDFIDCNFPFAERPDVPGPVRHIAYVYSLAKLPTGEWRIMGLFTTTSPRMIEAIPQGLSVSVPATVSLRMGMRNAFVIDVHRMAILPPEPDWFPDIGRKDFVLGSADEQLRNAVDRRVEDMRRRFPPVVQLLGPQPGRPGRK